MSSATENSELGDEEYLIANKSRGVSKENPQIKQSGSQRTLSNASSHHTGCEDLNIE
jgi:hypothetical protein